MSLGRVALLFLLLSLSAWGDRIIVPRQRVGPVRTRSVRADLDKIDGVRPEDLKDSWLETLAGRLPTTEVWPQDPQRHLRLVWSDDKREKVVSVLVRGSVWRTEEGVAVGVAMRKLQAINSSRPFRFYSFGMGANAGVVTSWRGGAMPKLLDGIRVVLTPKVPGFDALTPVEKAGLLEEGEFASDSPLAVKLNPVVESLEVLLGEPPP